VTKKEEIFSRFQVIFGLSRIGTKARKKNLMKENLQI
jgi:hypothetical protein